jgi:hypothetical protein
LIEERQDDPARFTSSKRAGSRFGLMPIENKWNYGVLSGNSSPEIENGRFGVTPSQLEKLAINWLLRSRAARSFCQGIAQAIFGGSQNGRSGNVRSGR